jgi:ketol-acid reductoisomerase
MHPDEYWKPTFDEENRDRPFESRPFHCGGFASLVKAGFETLEEAGYLPR